MIFLSDLDNTLIFSYKKMSPDNLCVETKEGKALSYMTRSAAVLFREMTEKMTFIPITTRSVEQYSRITFPGGFVPELAVVSNGANLLVNGVPDDRWREETEDDISACASEFSAFERLLKSRPEVYFDIRIVDGAFLFTKCKNAAHIIALMNREISPLSTELFTNGDKLYALPLTLGKETALARLRKRFLGEKFIAAGDSLFDEKMLRSADIAIVKFGELSGKQLNACQLTETSDDPDFALRLALRASQL
ncbi:MAG: hypothetical protein NC078_00245 [Ruminococcus sp.]|nr:hypothetical protein [Ruminococcus sp.]